MVLKKKGIFAVGCGGWFCGGEWWDVGDIQIIINKRNNTIMMKKVLFMLSMMVFALTAAAQAEADSVTATFENPQGGYIYYSVKEGGNVVRQGLAHQGTTTITIARTQTLCAEFYDINPIRQQSVVLGEGAHYVDEVLVNGQPYVFNGSDDYWDDYGYRIYTICSTYDSPVVFTASFLPYTITEADTADATLVVVNHGNGYARRYDPTQGMQYHIANTNYYTLAEGEQMLLLMGTFMPGSMYANIAPDSAQRLLHFYLDGEEVDLSYNSIPGLTVLNLTAEGYTFYNYRYTQDGVKHRIEFVFGPYEDTTVCEPVSMPTVTNLTQDGATVMWMASPSAESYTVLMQGAAIMETTETSVSFNGLTLGTEYAISIVTHCYNGEADTVDYSFSTLGAAATMTVSTNGGWLDQWDLLGEGTYTYDGYVGQSLVFRAYTLDYDRCVQNGIAPERGTLEAVYVNGVSIALDGSDTTILIDNTEAGHILYSYTAKYGEVDSIRFVFGPCAGYDEPCAAVSSWWVSDVDSSSATLYWLAPEGSAGEYDIVVDGEVVATVLSAATTVSHTFRNLTMSTTYNNIYIRSKCDNGNWSTSEEVSFSTTGVMRTFTVTKNRNGYLYYSLQSDSENGESITGVGTTTYSVDETDGMVLEAVSFSPDHYTDYVEVLGEDAPAADAITVESIYLDGQEIDISNESYDYVNENVYVTYGNGYVLQIMMSMEQNGFNVYVVTVTGEGDHELVFNYGEGETVENYNVSISSNDATLGTVFGDFEGTAGSVPAGTELEVYAMPQGGVTFVGWAEGSETNIVSQSNPLQVSVNGDKNIIGVFTTANLVTVEVHDTVYLSSTDTVYLYNTDTVYVSNTDTVYVYDTVYVGVDGVETDAAVKLYSKDNQIVVEGAHGADVVLYDAVGRRLAVRRDDFGAVRFEVPATGTYLVRVGQYPARRVVVVK